MTTRFLRRTLGPIWRPIRRVLVGLLHWGEQLGIRPDAMVRAFRDLPQFARDRREWNRQAVHSSSAWEVDRIVPRLGERAQQGGTMSGHYFHQDLLVARRVYERGPRRHIDVGSRTDGFVAHVAVFREIEILDIRPIASHVDNVVFRQADLMSLPADLVECTDSASSLHAVEHFGLGRYGDPVDVGGHIKAIDSLHRMLKAGGTLYFSVPVSHTQRIEFNSQRVFSIPYLLDLLQPLFSVRGFWYVNDAGELVDADLSQEAAKRSFDCSYGCAIFELEKVSTPRASQ